LNHRTGQCRHTNTPTKTQIERTACNGVIVDT